MTYKSASTNLTDAYRAGCEIGESLKEGTPEVILIFASITFETEYDDFYSGLFDGLDSRDVIVFGGTGDGIYESKLTVHYGVCALGINSGGKTKWSVALEEGVDSDSQGKARRCASAALARLEGKAHWAFVLADGLTADGTEIASGVRDVLNFTFIGGLTGDDRKFTRSRILSGGKSWGNSVAILLASGSMPFLTHTSSGFEPLGDPGIVEISEGRTIKRVSGKSALEFVRDQIGKPVDEADLGILAFANYIDSSQGIFYMRSFFRFDRSTGAVTTFGSIPAGTTIKVSSANREQLLQAVTRGIKTALESGFVPKAAVMISCAGRKWLLEEWWQEEVQAIQKAIGPDIPLVGFPSLGEIGPFLNEGKSWCRSYFHSATLVICLLGA